jgi:OOP family OmpA-OmpF porin
MGNFQKSARAIGAALIAAAWTLPAAAVNTESYEIPYFTFGPTFFQPDSVRNSDNGLGYQVMFGMPFESDPKKALEVRFFDYGYKRHFDGLKNYQTGIFVDYGMDFGTFGNADSFVGGTKPFVSGGIGAIQEDAFGDKHLHVGADLGGGLLTPIFFKGWAIRLEARVQGQSNSQTCKGAPTCTGSASYLVDYQVNLGLQMPLTIFWDRKIPVAPAPECPLKVVNPETGRTDCAGDADGDGVPDAKDQCPGTSPGIPVDKKGCPVRHVSSDDEDGDGVANGDDKCPGTVAGVKVNGKGCAVTQTATLRGVTFQASAAKLTSEGQRTLDEVVVMLTNQKNLKLEIAGHTDSVGSDAFNTLLSQQRADAVKTYLVEKGVTAEMAAVGYGSSEPIGDNTTDSGRAANRRVEFRLTAE